MSIIIPVCPHCNNRLEVIVLLGAHPPLKCNTCVRAWWHRELQTDAVAAWDEESRSYNNPQIVDDCIKERLAALNRGTSVTTQTVALLTPEQRKLLLSWNTVNPELKRMAQVGGLI